MSRGLVSACGVFQLLQLGVCFDLDGMTWTKKSSRIMPSGFVPLSGRISLGVNEMQVVKLLLADLHHLCIILGGTISDLQCSQMSLSIRTTDGWREEGFEGLRGTVTEGL